jgi:hypothetical protein
VTEEEARARFDSAKRSLIDNMALYGVPEDQAVVQVESLTNATRKLAESSSGREEG